MRVHSPGHAWLVTTQDAGANFGHRAGRSAQDATRPSRARRLTVAVRGAPGHEGRDLVRRLDGGRRGHCAGEGPLLAEVGAGGTAAARRRLTADWRRDMAFPSIS